MTKKRYIQKQDFFIDTEDLSISYACANEIDCKNIVNKLNQLNDENKHLIRKRGELETKNVILKGENEELKQSVNNLKETIIKITIAFQRKHDSTIVDLVDEIHEEDITDLIKELME